MGSNEVRTVIFGDEGLIAFEVKGVLRGIEELPHQRGERLGPFSGAQAAKHSECFPRFALPRLVVIICDRRFLRYRTDGLLQCF